MDSEAIAQHTGMSEKQIASAVADAFEGLRGALKG
jgi:hypothetical protein